MSSVPFNSNPYTHGGGSLQTGHVNEDQTSAGPSNSSSFEVWNNFFLSAGIPTNVANDYAVTFSQHRIRIDMLKDITKEILLDMGIKAMGDIIAILRHAKSICAQDELKGSLNIKAPSPRVSHQFTLSNPNNEPAQHQISQERLKLMTTTKLPPRNLTSSSMAVAQSSSNNKIQSRISLNSGALQSGQHKRQQPQPNSDELGNNKRPLTGISDSMAKRLKPAPNISDRRFTEKTLTVILPSVSASSSSRGSLNTSSSNSGNNNNYSSLKGPQVPVSIKSRLGGSPDATRMGTDSPTLLTSSARSRQVDLRQSLNHTHKSSQSMIHTNHELHSDFRRKQVEHTHRHSDDRSRMDHNSNYNKSKPRAPVFSRLR